MARKLTHVQFSEAEYADMTNTENKPAKYGSSDVTMDEQSYEDSKEKSARYSITMPASLANDMSMYGKITNLKNSKIIQEALREYLGRNDRKTAIKKYREAMSSLQI